MAAHKLTAEQVQALPYSEAFTILLYEKELSDYQRKYQELACKQ